MSLTKLGERKYCIVWRGKFRSLTGWTIVFEFCKRYDFSTAAEIIEKRFHRMKPRPKIEKCSKYEKQIKKAEQNKAYQKGLKKCLK